MKKSFLLFLVIFVLAATNSTAGVLILEGKYQSKNLYVQNGYAGNGVGFCTYEIRINGKISSDEINSSAFEIDFEASNIKLGASVIVEIKYKDDCMPKILNPDDIKPKATFDVVDIAITKAGLLSWSTKNETGSFFVLQLNKPAFEIAISTTSKVAFGFISSGFKILGIQSSLYLISTMTEAPSFMLEASKSISKALEFISSEDILPLILIS